MERKPHEILQLALDTGRYLNPGKNGEWHMCYLLASLYDEKVITHKEEASVVSHIYNSFEGAFLIGALQRKGIVPEGMRVKDDAFKPIAYAHWENLIEKLKSL